MLPVIAFFCVIISCVMGFWLQKNCKPTSIRFHGKKIEVAKKMVVADVYEVFIKNGKYYAKCGVPDEESQQTIEIDKSMMAAFPDQQNDGKPALKVMLYEETTDVGMKVYTLAPEEIRFKFNLHVVQDDQKTLADIQQASLSIGGYYQVRLVLWTLAWVGVYRSSMLSILFSVLAGIISIRNIVPLRCTFMKKCGIISTNTKSEGNTKSKAEVPPGFDNWSPESQYMYSLEQRMKNAKKAAADNADGSQPVDVSEQVACEDSQKQDDTDNSADATTTDESDADADSDSSEEDESSDDEDVEMPFFTDDELAQEGEDAEDETAEEDSSASPSSDLAAFDDETADDDGFEADGFEADDTSEEAESTDAQAPDESVSSEKDMGQTSDATTHLPASSHGKKRSGKKTVKSVLDDLMDDTSE